LQKDNKWEVSGFTIGNYSDGDALAVILLSTAYDTWAIDTAWTANTWYDSDDISDSLQEAIDDYEYDPLHAQDKYIGIRVHPGDAAGDQFKNFYMYDYAAADAPEVDMTFTARGERQFMGIYIVDRDGNVRVRAY